MSSFGERIKLYFKKRKHRISVSGISVRTDWYVILATTALLFLLAGAYGGLTYRSIADGSAFMTDQPQPQDDSEQKKSDIAKAVENIKGR